jgi:hypothetical protein
MGGAKPLDEAIVNDQMFRVNTFRQKDLDRRKALGSTIRTTLLTGSHPSEEQVNEYAYKYAKAGGKQDEFANWFAGLVKDTNVSQAEQLRSKLGGPFSQNMQYIMQGYAEEPLGQGEQ